MSAKWWLLIHQIPPKPPYLRTKIANRLAKLGAIAVKNSVYALPGTESALEDLQWVRRDIVAGGGEGVVVESRFVDGLSDAELEGMFRAARDADYHALANELRDERTRHRRKKQLADADRRAIAAAIERGRKRMLEIGALDFFAASGREVVAGLVGELEARLGGDAPVAEPRLAVADYRGRTWVTRQNIHVDRIACTWLIKRFVDPDARFVFVANKHFAPQAGELRFDMFDGEFTHEGEKCSFEVIVERFGLRDAGLRAIAEIVHDIDLKDGKFARTDADGVARVISAIALGARDDVERMARGAALFEDLHRLYGKHG